MGLGCSHLAVELQCLRFSNSIIAAVMLINFDVISLPVARQQQQQQWAGIIQASVHSFYYSFVRQKNISLFLFRFFSPS